jgi:hypothetical protein
LFKFGNQALGNFLVSMNRDDLNALKDLIEAGKVTPVMDRVYALNDTANALRHVGRGHLRGKVTISTALEQSPPAPSNAPASSGALRPPTRSPMAN